MKRLAIIGSSDLGQLMAHHATVDKHYKVVGFYDDYKIKTDLVDGFKILGKIANIEIDFKNGLFDFLMVAVGYKHINFRKEIFETFLGHIPFATIIHSSCFVDKSAIIKEGCFVLPGCILDRNVILEENVLLNIGCVIAHDSSVGRHSFLSPAVKMAGFSKIGNSCNIGINTTIIDNISLSDNVRTGGGAVIIKNIYGSGLYIGMPAKKHIKL